MDISLIFLRLVVPLFIFRSPLLGGLLALFLDGIDWEASRLLNTINYDQYHTIDKLLDMYYLSFEAFSLRFWEDAVAKRIGYVLYGYRLLGVLLFSLFHARFLLFLFPNLFEVFFLFYVAKKTLTKDEYIPRNLLYLFIPYMMVPKLFQEYVIHVSQKTMWQFSDFHIYNWDIHYDHIFGQLVFVLLFLLVVRGRSLFSTYFSRHEKI